MTIPIRTLFSKNNSVRIEERFVYSFATELGQFRIALRGKRAAAQVGRDFNMSQLARDVGMSLEGLNKALSGDGNPTLATVMKVAKALGLRVGFRPTA
ncbi:MAG TPA: helix-turn-helix domain-containing protein [Acidocella sp.]|jgi:probable addiction module antidote protein|uniref:helix-turn-helix domain-containing transcriptional regulator n=1 Tax=Acidocella sp. TaxID=50710 RepID=UPI002CD0EB53|nr:helix-turn-helix domain-containing protein [Acidocella sp.]HVE21184.1 helix-turn-helix domain-containing protein [Acidocella sp.]